jgi:hypothetical protein
MEFRAMEGLQLEDHVRDSRYLEDPHEIQHFVDDTSIGSSWGAAAERRRYSKTGICAALI